MGSEFEGRETEKAASGPAPKAPATGDDALDAVLADLASAQDAALGERIDAGERALSVLQSRLNDLGGT